VRRQTRGYLPSRRTSPSLDRYRIILLTERGICVWTTCPRLLPENAWSVVEPATSWVASPTSKPLHRQVTQVGHLQYFDISKSVWCEAKVTAKSRQTEILWPMDAVSCSTHSSRVMLTGDNKRRYLVTVSRHYRPLRAETTTHRLTKRRQNCFVPWAINATSFATTA